MATIKIVNTHLRQFGGSPPYGNVTQLPFVLTTDSSGVAENSDDATAVANGDVIDLGPLPAGMRLADADMFITTAMTASVTGKLGFKYTDGVDDATVPQDDDYFFTAYSLASAARKRADTGNLVTLPKAARLILTIGGADNAKVSDIKFLISGELTGNK